jgi:hypothetical protein
MKVNKLLKLLEGMIGVDSSFVSNVLEVYKKQLVGQHRTTDEFVKGLNKVLERYNVAFIKMDSTFDKTHNCVTASFIDLKHSPPKIIIGVNEGFAELFQSFEGFDKLKHTITDTVEENIDKICKNFELKNKLI